MLSFFQTYSAGINSIIATVGAVIGLYWWFCKRERKPKLTLDVDLEHVKLDEGKYLVRIIVLAKNYGQVLLKTNEVRIYLHPIKPIPIDPKTAMPFDFTLVPVKNEYYWPKIMNTMDDNVAMDYEFEPGDSGPLIFERVLSELPDVVSAYVYIKNNSKRGPIGWTTTKLFRITNKNS